MGSMSDWELNTFFSCSLVKDYWAQLLLACFTSCIDCKEGTEDIDKRLEIDFTNLPKAILNFATARHSTEVSVAVIAKKLLKPFKALNNLNFINKNNIIKTCCDELIKIYNLREKKKFACKSSRLKVSSKRACWSSNIFRCVGVKTFCVCYAFRNSWIFLSF